MLNNPDYERKVSVPQSHRDNIYLNCIINPDPYLGQRDSPCVFNETLTQAVIGDPSKYYCSVARFTLPLSNIPILLFPLDTSQTNPLQSRLQIGINIGGTYPSPSSASVGVGGTYFSQPIMYVPDNNLPIPRAVGPFTNADEVNQFYWIYSITQFLEMFNTALSAAYTASGIVGTPIPYYSYDSNTQLISLHVTDAFLNYAGNPKIYMNALTVNYLESFKLYQDVLSPQTNPGQLYFFHDLRVLPTGAVTPYTIVEDYNSISLWFSLRKIVVTSSTLPVTPEVIPGKNGGTVTYLPILTDFSIDLASTVNLGDVAIYNPSFYRLVDMSTHVPITQVSLEFLWEDRFGNIIPILIEPFQSASIKLAFQKKSLYNDNPQSW